MGCYEHGIAASEITEAGTFFTFSSGSLTYDCIRCNAACCRGHGYLLERSHHRDEHLALAPNLHVFLDPHGSDPAATFVRVRSCPPGCFFLSERGLCGIQLAYGYAAKPETCRLFPFNYLRRVGNHLVVAPHTRLCPLAITPKGARDQKSEHGALLGDLRREGISARVPVCDVGWIQDVGRLLGLEREIVTVGGKLDGTATYADFAATQLALTYSHFPTTGERCAVGAEEASSRIQRFGDRATHALGVSDRPAEDPRVVRTLVAATSSLRASMLFRHKENPEGLSVGDIGIHRVPYAVFGIYLLATLARNAGMVDVTFQTVFDLHRAFGPILFVLVNSDRKMVWRRGTSIPLSLSQGDRDLEGPYLRVVKALLDESAHNTFGEVVGEYSPRDPASRVRFLGLLGTGLRGRLIDTRLRSQERPTFRAAVRGAVQRLAFALVDDNTLSRLAHRRRLVRGPGSVQV